MSSNKCRHDQVPAQRHCPHRGLQEDLLCFECKHLRPRYHVERDSAFPAKFLTNNLWATEAAILLATLRKPMLTDKSLKGWVVGWSWLEGERTSCRLRFHNMCRLDETALRTTTCSTSKSSPDCDHPPPRFAQQPMESPCHNVQWCNYLQLLGICGTFLCIPFFLSRWVMGGIFSSPAG